VASQPLAHIRPIKPQVFAGSQAGNWLLRGLPPAATFLIDPADADLQPRCQLLGCQNVGRIQSIRIHINVAAILRCLFAKSHKWLVKAELTSRSADRWSSRAPGEHKFHLLGTHHGAHRNQVLTDGKFGIDLSCHPQNFRTKLRRELPRTPPGGERPEQGFVVNFTLAIKFVPGRIAAVHRSKSWLAFQTRRRDGWL
jgi:hypothetical protein